MWRIEYNDLIEKQHRRGRVYLCFRCWTIWVWRGGGQCVTITLCISKARYLYPKQMIAAAILVYILVQNCLRCSMYFVFFLFPVMWSPTHNSKEKKSPKLCKISVVYYFRYVSIFHIIGSVPEIMYFSVIFLDFHILTL